MSTRKLELEPADFITTCRVLTAAGRGRDLRIVVDLRFSPSRLLIESEWGGGVVRTNGTFEAHVRIRFGILRSVASHHADSLKTGKHIQCVLDETMGEIRFPRCGFKAQFEE